MKGQGLSNGKAMPSYSILTARFFLTCVPSCRKQSWPHFRSRPDSPKKEPNCSLATNFQVTKVTRVRSPDSLGQVGNWSAPFPKAQEDFGPSGWRQTGALGPRPRSAATYPGTQSDIFGIPEGFGRGFSWATRGWVGLKRGLEGLGSLGLELGFREVGVWRNS